MCLFANCRVSPTVQHPSSNTAYVHIWANRDIRKDEELTIQYQFNLPLDRTLRRNILFQSAAHFWCSCEVCEKQVNVYVCSECSLPTIKKLECAKCKQITYCSKGCQVKNWPAHKKSCSVGKNNLICR